MRPFLLAIWIIICALRFPLQVSAQNNSDTADGKSSAVARQGGTADVHLIGQTETNVLRAQAGSSSLRAGAKTSVFEGSADETRLEGGLDANRYQNSKSSILQPQQGEMDPATKSLMMQLIMRKQAKPQASLLQAPPLAPLQGPVLPTNRTLPGVVANQRVPMRALMPRVPSYSEIANPRMLAPPDPNAFFWQVSTMRLMPPMTMLRPIPSLGAPVRLYFTEENQEFDQRLQYLHSFSGSVGGAISLPSSNTLDDRLSALHAKSAQALGREKETVQELSVAAQAKLPGENFNEDETVDNVLSWNAWYARLANALKEPLLKSVNAHSKVQGRDVLTIEVSSDLTIVATVKKPSNPEFDSAVLDAYRGLMFNPVLQFPIGSQRKKVVFETEQVHEREGEAVAVETQELMNDLEHQTVRKPRPGI